MSGCPATLCLIICTGESHLIELCINMTGMGDWVMCNQVIKSHASEQYINRHACHVHNLCINISARLNPSYPDPFRHVCCHREMERREKVEEARKETERILAQQEAEVRARKQEMERRDKERLERMAKEAEEKAVTNAVKKKQAEERIASE